MVIYDNPTSMLCTGRIDRVLSAPPIYPTKSDPMGEVIEVTCDKG